jgi:enamine deaminase RidA (YjgF/YER057c/UK114 family)
MPEKAKTIRRYINLPDRKTPLPFSDAVLVGDTLYLAGRIGIDPVTRSGTSAAVGRFRGCAAPSGHGYG